MIKKKTARVAAFVGTLGASAALIGMAATNTGAYFTDSENGNLSASSGHLQVDKNSDYNLNFDNLVPGEYKTREVGYKTDSSTPEDIWLKFPAGVDYGKFTGAKNVPDPGGNNNVDGWADGGLGRFGHFEVARNDGTTVFSSWNLQNQPNGTSGCGDSNGHGSNTPPADRDATPAYCGVPHYILLDSNVPSLTQAKFTMTFGATGRWTGQSLPVANVPFQVVATQHNVRPDASSF
jgi:hypothetical protein